ncbi:MAG: OmpA family protein [Bacteroidales bacterium]|nr:OmpA family protein [Bacteroidales bacterium]
MKSLYNSNNKRRIILLLIFSNLFLINIFSQDIKVIKKLYVEAESAFLYEDYITALPLYLEIENQEFTNANIDYAIGMCYLFTTGQKEKSIPYLESAILDMSTERKDGSYKETKAPEEAMFYLGRAYLINNKLDKAIESFKSYRQILEVEEVYTINIVDNKINQCNNAIEMIKNPVRFTKENLGEKINTEDDNFNAVLSSDENTMIFTIRQEIYDREYDETNTFDFIYYTQYIDGAWVSPKNITSKIGSEGFCSSVDISSDGKKMLLFRDDWGVGNIYESHAEGKKWLPIEKLGKNISSKSLEAHACYTNDGNTIYFVSDRQGGYGGLDIYRTTIDSKGKWGVPVNLGTTINTAFNEETPFITDDGKTLFFSSEGHYSIGGLDIFQSKLSDNGEWSVPLNIGYPINTTDDDMFFYPVENGKYGYYAMINKDGFGGKDIYKIQIDVGADEIVAETDYLVEDNILPKTDSLLISSIDSIPSTELPVNEPGETTGITTARSNESFITYGGDYGAITEETKTEIKEFIVKGIVSLQDNKEIDNTFKIDIKNISNSEIIATISPDISTGNYSKKILAGNYQLIAHGSGYQEKTENLTIPENYPLNEINVNIELVPLSVSSGEYYRIKSVFFDYNEFSLNRESKIEIEKLFLVMEKNPSLYIEVIGHTDALGSTEYNKNLSVKRSRSVIDYMDNKGIDHGRFVAKGVGESDNIAINTNPDGSDNPEGRRYNRRVDVKILKSDNNLVIVEDVSVPTRLQAKPMVSYTILLAEHEKELPPSYFNKYDGETINNVWVFPTSKGYMYTVGEYKHKAEALFLLNKAIDAGFPDAEIITSDEFKKQKATGETTYIEKVKKEKIKKETGTYTIQLLALKHPVDLSYFKQLNGVKKHKGNDDFFRYTYGKFGYNTAKEECQKIIEMGYPGAFVRNVNKYK